MPEREDVVARLRRRLALGFDDPIGAIMRWSRRSRGLAARRDRIERARAAGLLGRRHAPAPPAPAAARRPIAPTGAELAFVAISTRSHLPFAAILAEAVARHHPEAAFHLVLVDGPAQVAGSFAGAHVHAAVDLGIPYFGYLALALEPHHLCYVLKPFALARLLDEGGYRRAVYLDSDLLLLAPLTSLLAELEQADLVLTPHRLRLPDPSDARGATSSLLDLTAAGSINAGVVGARSAGEGPAFLETWGREITSPAALRADQSELLEQRLLGLAPALCERCRFLRDPAVNVAYWNLDERSLRWAGLDGGAVDGFRVGGAPLVAFHFSGYDPRRPEALSRFASVDLLGLHPSAAALAAAYQCLLEARGARQALEVEYGFARLPSGLMVDSRLRLAFRLHSEDLFGDEDPWAEIGEAAALERLFRPARSAESLQPPLIAVFVRERPDLAHHWPDSELDSRALLPWLGSVGMEALGWRELFARYAPLRPAEPALDSLLDALGSGDAALDPLPDPLGSDRPEWVRRLRAAGADQLATQIEQFALELFAVSPTAAAIEIWEARPDVQSAFPDPLARHAEAYASWLASDGGPQHGLDGEALAADWRDRAQGRSLARLHSALIRQGGLAARFPLGLAGVELTAFARELLRYVRADCEFDLDDLRLFLFSARRWPEIGLSFALELPENRGALDTEDARKRIAERLRDGVPEPGPALRVLEAERERRRDSPPLHSDGPAVNLYGYFRSPIGLGVSTLGVASALRSAGFAVSKLLLSNAAMDRDLELADFRDRRRPDALADIWVTYPHYHEDLPARHAPCGSRTPRIAYLAWEQRDGHPGWKRQLGGFDRLVAVSSFAADAVAAATGRPVAVIPNVVDVAALPAAASKRAAGLDPARRTFFYCFDVASSFERKNPLAVIEAFERAFRPGEAVELVLRAANGRAPWLRVAAARLRARATACPLPVRIVDGPLDRGAVLALIAAADVYVSLHRGEGFGLTLAEAMAYSRPVIATRYSGNLDFMTDANSFLVDCREVELRVSEGPFRSGSVWAEPDVEHAAWLMRHVVDAPDEAARRAALGHETVRDSLSPARVGARLADLLGTSTSEPRAD